MVTFGLAMKPGLVLFGGGFCLKYLGSFKVEAVGGVAVAVPGRFLGQVAHQWEAEDLTSLWLPLVGLLDPLGLGLKLMFRGIFAVF